MKLPCDNVAAYKRPWRIERITRQREAVIKSADNSIVAVCHADNAELIVKCVNDSQEATMRLTFAAGAMENPETGKPKRLQTT